MSEQLNIKWTPGFGSIYTWFAMDSKKQIAMMINNCYGDLPKVLLMYPNVEKYLDDFAEACYEESSCFYIPDKENGTFTLDLYSVWRYKSKYYSSKVLVEKAMMQELIESGKQSVASVAANKGIYVYEAVEGSCEGEDFPVGYDDVSKMGDYFRHLVPNKLTTISDIPERIRNIIVVSKTLDFSKLRLLPNDEINFHFKEMYI